MLRQVLVVAHERSIGAALTSMLIELGVPNVIEAAGPEHAMTALDHGVDAAFLFAAVPDGLALRVARSAVRACPVPSVFVLSSEPHPDLFALAQAGARAHLVWPTTSEDVRQCLECNSWPASLDDCVRSLVGRVGIKDAQTWLRNTMLQQALDASGGSRRAAAKLLGVTRPAIQRMVRESDLPTSGDSAPTHAPPPLLRPGDVRPVRPLRNGHTIVPSRWRTG